MANPTCTKANLVAGMACYKGTRLSTHDQQTRLVYFKVLQLAAIGGTDYTSAVNTLFADANTLACGFQPDDYDAANVRIQENNAGSAGATIPSTQAALADAVKCYKKFDERQLKQANLLLDCALGRAKSYPQ